MSFNLLVEFALHFTSFRNIDLLQQGIYHVKAQLVLHPRSSLLLPVSGHASSPGSDDAEAPGSPRTASLPHAPGGGVVASPDQRSATGASSRVRLGDASRRGEAERTASQSAESDPLPGAASASNDVCLRRLLTSRSRCALAAVPYTYFSSPLEQDEGTQAASGGSSKVLSGVSSRVRCAEERLQERKFRTEQQQHWAYGRGAAARRPARDANEAVLLLLQDEQQGAEPAESREASAWGIQHKRAGEGENRNCHALVPPKINEVDNSFSTRGFLIRYCDEQVALSDTVCFRVEVPFSSPAALTHMFALLQLSLWFTPHLPHPASHNPERSDQSAGSGGKARGNSDRDSEKRAESSRRASANRSREPAPSSAAASSPSEAAGAAAGPGQSSGVGDRPRTQAGVHAAPSRGQDAGSRPGPEGKEGRREDGSRASRDADSSCLAVKFLLLSNFLTGLQAFVPVIFDEGQFALVHMLLIASVVDIRLRLRPSLPLSPFPLPVSPHFREQRRCALHQFHRVLQKCCASQGAGREGPGDVRARGDSGKLDAPPRHSRGSETSRRVPRGHGPGRLVLKSVDGDGAAALAQAQSGEWIDEEFEDEDGWSDLEPSSTRQRSVFLDHEEPGSPTGNARRRDADQLGPPDLLLTLDPSLSAFLVGAGTAFAEAGGAVFSASSARRRGRLGATGHANEVTAAAANAAGAARAWLGERGRVGTPVPPQPRCETTREDAGFDEESLLGGAAALHAACLQLLLDVYLRLAAASAKLFARCLLPERRQLLLPLQHIDGLTLPGGGVLDASGASFRDPPDLLAENKVAAGSRDDTPPPMARSGCADNFMRLLISQDCTPRSRRCSSNKTAGSNGRRAEGDRPQLETDRSGSGVIQGSETEAWADTEPGVSSNGAQTHVSGARNADGAGGGDADSRQQPFGGRCVAVKVLRLETRLKSTTPDEICSLIASDVHVLSRQLFTLWSRLLASVPIISHEMELLLRVNWEQQYASRLSAFVLQHVVPLRPSDRLYFPPPAVAELPHAATAGVSPSALIPPVAAASAAAAVAALALARRGNEANGDRDDSPDKPQQGAVAAVLCASEEAMLDLADAWRGVVDELHRRPMDVHDCRLLVASDRHPIVFEQRYRTCAFSVHPPVVPPCLPLAPPSSSLSSSHDMRLLRNNIAVFFRGAAFLCSSANQDHTEGDIEMMGKRLADEVHAHIQECFPLESLARLSFIGHSLGGVIIRAALPHLIRPYGSRFFLYLSLSSPHFGFVKSKSRLVSLGVWLLKKWRKSLCLQQLTLSDAKDYSQAFLYRLSRRPGLSEFQHICLVASSQDTYAPLQSAAILLHHPRAASIEPSGASFSQGARVGSGPKAFASADASPSERMRPAGQEVRSGLAPHAGASWEGANGLLQELLGKGDAASSGRKDSGTTRNAKGRRSEGDDTEEAEQPTRQSQVVELMGRNLLGNISPEKVMRLNVNFRIAERNFDSFIGRAAHILFLENQTFMRTLLLSHPYLFK
ncbi:f21m12.37 protein, related [Neospora caninum Liverpool]|uniref:F21m12.37 protein, related n=1 Tax=Neospora caninum (strain Liverpool) TaxID=572307 RepID=F0V9K3_NEOCL|nr:f21m12.37 protein, related [Neospora caninum Liverpool]CBZ50429.1 f21m12.37 protein, related [Neospora caninum Liverpool]|eukprot:XP_003880462.1 f21m12.37 protein, related [Neospora caninum Liverpool]